MKNLQNPSCGSQYGFGVGISELTRTHTHHAHTQVPAWVCKPMMGTSYSAVLALHSAL